MPPHTAPVGVSRPARVVEMVSSGPEDVGGGGEAGKLPAGRARYLDLFQYADMHDKVIILLGFIGAVGEGAVVPGIVLVLRILINKFGSLQNNPSELTRQVGKYCLYMVFVAIAAAVFAYLEVSCWIKVGERQSSLIRTKYLRAILRQEVGYFDGKGTTTAEVVTSVAKDSQAIQDAMSEKVGNMLANVVQLFIAYVVGFYICWELALVALTLTPVVLVPGFMYKAALTDITAKIRKEYDRANVIAEESVSSIRTVYSFAAEERTVDSFAAALTRTKKLGAKQGLAKGFALASSGFSYLVWAVMSLVGQRLVSKRQVNGADVVLTGFLIINSAISLGQATPSIRAFGEGALAGQRIFRVINRQPLIESDDLSGDVLEDIQGRIEFRDVSFCYPSRPDVPVLQGFSLRVAAGMNVALVGSSGSGKSTAIALLERFYDPQAGEVLIDGVDVRRLQLKSLRRQIGLVSQEPALFATTIKENILYGKDGASMEEVVQAAKAANAHAFISECPQGYETQVGERGVQMSGGQKQRIAIARALLKNPPILLLDEATSALDAESERVVQETLDVASKGRTTLTVAHRLSTIRSADNIAVMQSGVVIEMGTHQELISREGVYKSLIALQQREPAKDCDHRHARQDSDSSLKAISGHASRHPSRGSSLSRSFRMLSLTGSFRRAVSEAVHERDDVESMMEHTHPAETQYDEEKKPVSFTRLLAMNAPEWKQGLLAITGAVAYGTLHPTFAYLLGQLLESFYNSKPSKTAHEVHIVAGVFAGLMIVGVLSNVTQHYYFAVMGDELTTRVRKSMLHRILTFEVGWFDRDENSSGAVCSRLSSDAAMVRSWIGDQMALAMSTLSTVTVAYCIVFTLSWRLAVVLIALQPLSILSYATKRMFLDRFAKISADSQQEASKIAGEAVSQFRTITAFSSQEKVMCLFDSKLRGPHKRTQIQSQMAGILVGGAIFALYSSWAFMLWFGVQTVKHHRASFGTFIKAFFVVVGTGRILADAIVILTPDLARSSQAVASVFQILDRKTEIEPDDPQGYKPSKIRGDVEFKNVTFAYPERPHILVFKSFNLNIAAGRTVAIVGQSGSGKSTIISLIERYYEPQAGTVLIDGRDITLYNLRALRAHVGLVGQEPTLFATSVRDNIAYGRPTCTEAEVIEAAKAANAHFFISSLPDGYDTFAGARGLQLSGGQKQRIAIARAVLKNPAILLLDEATSALDAESEALVQSALEKIMVGRTTVVVAHRLSTIQQANTIAVLQEGRVLEQGTHQELMGKGDTGAYFSLVQMQTKHD